MAGLGRQNGGSNVLQVVWPRGGDGSRVRDLRGFEEDRGGLTLNGVSAPVAQASLILVCYVLFSN